MKTVLMLLAPLTFLAAQNQSAQSQSPQNQSAQNQGVAPKSYVEREVGRELAKLPYVTIYDDVEYKVEGYNVILTGEVRRAMLKSNAEKLARRVEGVEKVINQIEVLPLSPNDEAIRRATYLALVRQPTLQSYFWPNVWSIHIIVKNGDVKLEGSVSNQGDAELANLAAGAVPGIFSFTSLLEVTTPATTPAATRATKLPRQ